MISDIAHELGNHYPHVVNDFQINNIRSQLAVNNEVILFIGKVRDEIIQNTDKDGQGYDLISKSVKNSAQRERDKALEKREAIAKAQQKMDDRAVVDKYLKPESIEAAQKSDRIGFDSNVATLAKFLREGKTDRTALKAFGLNKAERIEVRHKVETELAELKLLERTTPLREPQPESFVAGAVQSKANGTGWTQGA